MQVPSLYGWMDRNGHIRVYSDEVTCREKHGLADYTDGEGTVINENSQILEFICMTPDINYEVRNAGI